MLPRISPRTRSVMLLFAVVGVLAFAGASPASAACTSDKPDLGFVDSNCDGIDGDKAAALFVAPNGSDADDGSFGHPMATVGAAVTAALASGKDVYVGAGTYTGKVAFLGAAGHIGVYGGYDPQTWQRSGSNVTTLESSHQVVFASLPGIVMQLLTIHGLVDATTTTSYGVRAVNGGGIALSRVTIQGAPGADGADGASSPPAPPTAPAGTQGKRDPTDCGGPVGAGGTGPDVLWGGRGGTAWDSNYPFSGHQGSNDIGYGVSGGQGGLNPEDPGYAGDPGKNGDPGAGGSAALNFSAGLYKAMPGSPGTAGIRGAGGGGGAGSQANFCLPGSGGGAGGRLGAGGAGGQGGGGSIGVFAGAGARVLLLDGSAIHTANGGKGGNGATGQPGGAGGAGGPAGVVTENGTTYHSGHGGNGGYGGSGGPGGSGAGGASVGVLAIDARAAVAADTTFTLGTGGPGGVLGNSGKHGVALQTAQITTAGGSLPAIGDFDGDGVDDASDACPIAAGPGNGCPPVETPDGQTGGGTPTPTGTDPSVPADTGTGTATTTGTGTSSGPTTGTGTLTISVLPSWRCMYKRVFRIRINARKAHLKTARLTLDRKRLKLVKGKRRWTARADLRQSARTSHTLTIRGTLRNGRRYKQTRRYRTCR
jgi:hypothetical protein